MESVKVGDVVYAILTLSKGYVIENVQVVEDCTTNSSGEEIEYYEVKNIETGARSGALKSRVFHTEEEAVSYREEIISREAKTIN